METFLTAIASFLGGALLTSLWYTFAFSSRLAKLEQKVDDHHKQPAPMCNLHQGMMIQQTKIDTELDEIKRRMDSVEKK